MPPVLLPALQPVDLRARLGARDPATLALLALAVYPAPTRLERTAQRYAERGWALAGLEDEAGQLWGLVGWEEGSDENGKQGPQGCTTLTHIAAATGRRGLGLGRELLALVQRQVTGDLYAETDATAAGFYRACGFSVVSLGFPYPGTERFACTWSPPLAARTPSGER